MGYREERKFRDKEVAFVPCTDCFFFVGLAQITGKISGDRGLEIGEMYSWIFGGWVGECSEGQ